MDKCTGNTTDFLIIDKYLMRNFMNMYLFH